MKHTLPFLLMLLLAGAMLQNCNCKHVCTSPVPVARLTNFDSADLSAVIVKKYRNNGLFNTPEQTTVYTTTQKSFYGTDTSYLDSNSIILEYFEDYTVEIPAAGKLWQLKNISLRATKMSERCTSGLNYTLNDIGYTVPAVVSTQATAAYIYLNK